MAINLRIGLVVAMVLTTLAVLVGTAFAGPGNSGDTKPGWGFGDKNHVHTGPPGQTVHPVR